MSQVGRTTCSDKEKKPANEHVNDMSQARTTIGREGMGKPMKKQVDDMSWIYMLTTNEKVNQVSQSKHVDTNATIN